MYRTELQLQTTPELLANWLEKHYVEDDRIAQMRRRPREHHLGDETWIVYEILPSATDWKEKYPTEDAPIFLSIGASLLSENPNKTEVEICCQTLDGLIELEELAQYLVETFRDGMLEKFGGVMPSADVAMRGDLENDETLSSLENGIIRAFNELPNNADRVTDESISIWLANHGILNNKGDAYSREHINRTKNKLIDKGKLKL